MRRSRRRTNGHLAHDENVIFCCFFFIRDLFDDLSLQNRSNITQVHCCRKCCVSNSDDDIDRMNGSFE